MTALQASETLDLSQHQADEPKVLLLVMSCGRRDYLKRTLEAFEEHVRGNFTQLVIHEDSGDVNMLRWLRRTCPDFEVITPGRLGRRAGFAGAIRSAWGHIATMGEYEWVFHLEDDFVFQKYVDLADVIDVMEHQTHLAQMAFRRQAWYEGDDAVIGPSDAAAGIAHGLYGHEWLEQDTLFTTNPSLYRRGVTKRGWPAGEGSERRFWAELKTHGLPWGVLGADVRAAFWGGMESGSCWVEHIGCKRPVGGHTY